VSLDGGDAGGAGRLDKDADCVGDQCHRGAYVVVGDEHDLVDECPRTSRLSAIGALSAKPPAIVVGGSLRTGRPVSMLSFIAGAPLAHTPTMCVSGERALSQRDATDQCAVADLDDDSVKRLGA
jgi:hypothetical protein